MFDIKNIHNLLTRLILLAGVGFVALLCGVSGSLAADAPDLGTAGTFGVLSNVYTNTSAGTTIVGDLGYTTGPAVTPTVTGTTYVADGTYTQAGLDQATALAILNGQDCMNLGPGALNLDTVDIGSGPGVFTPGCYSNGGAMNITVGQTVTLHGIGVYIFRPGGALTTEANTSFILQGGVCESDVYWAPIAATSIGANTEFVGNILAPSGITIGNAANLTGRALAFGGTVTTDTNTITVPPPCEVTLELLKTVNNAGSGTAEATDFTLTATGDASTGPTVVTGTTPVTESNVPLGVYALTETGPDGYTAGFSCSGGALVGNKLTITGEDAGNTITCTIANTFTGASVVKLGLLKTVSGGTAEATDFTLTATGDESTGPMIVAGTTPVTPVNVPVGVYTLTETGPLDYTAGFSCTGGGSLAGNTLTITETDAGNTITCTIANTYDEEGGAVAAQLGLLKTVNGGTASVTDFTLTATGDASTGPMIVTGTTPVPLVNVPVGVYTLTETGPDGYTAGFSCTGGGILAGNTLTITETDAGNTITCTITNTYSSEIPPSIPIPTLSEWGMIILMVLIGPGSIYLLRRRRLSI